MEKKIAHTLSRVIEGITRGNTPQKNSLMAYADKIIQTSNGDIRNAINQISMYIKTLRFSGKRENGVQLKYLL